MNSAERLALTVEVERALDGGPPVAVATVTEPGAGGASSGAKMLVRADGTSLGSLDGGLDEAVREAAGWFSSR